MKCHYCQRELVGDLIYRCWHCPNSVRYQRLGNDQYRIEIIFTPLEESPYYLIVDQLANKFTIEAPIMQTDRSRTYNRLLELDYIPDGITPSNAHEWVARALNLKVFS